MARMNKTDKSILHALEVVVDAISEMLGSNCEVVLHSFEDLSHSIIKIANGHVTGRKVGSPLTDLGIQVLEKADSLEKDVINSYYSKLEDGRVLKCATMIIRNRRGKPVGAMCINMDLSVPLLDFIRNILPESREPLQKVPEYFPSTLNELVSIMLETIMTQMSDKKELPPLEKKKNIIVELHKRGAFNVKGAIDVVANRLGISRYTVYNYVRDAKAKSGEG